MSRFPSSARARLAAAVAGVLATAAAAAETSIEPRVGVGGAYVSNVQLAPPGEEEHDWVGELKPGVTIAHDSARLKLDLDYDFQALFYAENGDFDDQFNTFLGNGTAILVPDRFFLDLDGRYEQRNVDPGGRATTSNLYRTGNRTDLGSWQVSPWYQQPFGDQAEGTLRYTYGEYNFRNVDDEAQDLPDNNLDDSSQQRIDVGLGSPEGAAGWTWRLDYLNSNVDYEFSDDYNYERAGAEIGVPVARRNHFLVAGGLETDFDGDPSEGGLDGSWWNVGWRWQPTDRQTVEARVGDRFWGNDYLFSWTRKGSRGDLSLKYEELPGSFGALEFSDGGGGIFGPGRISTTPYVSRRVNGSVTWKAARSDWRLEVSWDQRDYRSTGGTTDDTFSEDEEFTGALAGVRWQAFARTRVEFDARWYARSLQQGDVDTLELGLAFVRELTPQLEARLAGAWASQNADTGTLDEYDAANGFLGIVWHRR